jgi:hypothetical protein
MKYATIFCLLFALLTPVASAEQYVRGSQVVHTRVAPVVVHRVLPPFKGVHVYQGRTARR